MLIGMLNNRLNNLTRNKVGLVVKVNHTVNLRRVCLGATNGAFLVDLVNQHINRLADFGL